MKVNVALLKDIKDQIKATYLYGTMFAPKQCLYEKEATGMESLKM